jgi:hypothetical protein
MTYTIVADPRVKSDLIEARDFLNSRRKGFGKKFLTEYRNTLKSLEVNPFFQILYKDIHCLPMKTFKYMIHFKVYEETKTVHIYGLLSTHKNPFENWL